MEDIDSIYTLESRLSFGSICSVGILYTFEVILKIKFSINQECATLILDSVARSLMSGSL